MNAQNDHESSTDRRDARPANPGRDPYEPEAPTPKEGADSRETAERGYGWGV